MKFWLDTEFMEDGRTIDLLSIGVVAEDGHEFYRQNANADLNKANAWVKENVLPRLLSCPKGLIQMTHRGAKCGHPECPWRPELQISRELGAFVGLLSKPDGFTWVKPEFWGYYADYDWVAVCQLFGRMVDLPTGWPMYCRDLKQYVDSVGDFDLPPDGKDEHNALADARWIKRAYEYVVEVDNDYARRKEARSVYQESGSIRSSKKRGQRQVNGSGDLERAVQENR